MERKIQTAAEQDLFRENCKLAFERFKLILGAHGKTVNNVIFEPNSYALKVAEMQFNKITEAEREKLRKFLKEKTSGLEGLEHTSPIILLEDQIINPSDQSKKVLFYSPLTHDLYITDVYGESNFLVDDHKKEDVSDRSVLWYEFGPQIYDELERRVTMHQSVT